MSKNTIGWIDRDKMRAALAALRENQQKNRAHKTHEAPPHDDLVDLFGERAPLFGDDKEDSSFVHDVAELHDAQQRDAAQQQADADAAQQAASARLQAEAEVARVRAEAEVAAEAARVRAEAETARLQAEAEVAAQAARVRAEAEAETARLQAEAEVAAQAARVRAEAEAETARPQVEAEVAAQAARLRAEAEAETARQQAADEEARSLAAFYEAIPATAAPVREQSESDLRPPAWRDDEDEELDVHTGDEPVDRSLFAALSLLRNTDSRGTPHTAPHPSDDAGYEPAFPDLHRSSSAAARHTADAIDQELEDEALALNVGDVDLQLGQSAASFATLAPRRDAPANEERATGRHTLRIDEYVPFQDFDFDSDEEQSAPAEPAPTRESAMSEALQAIDHALDLALPPSPPAELDDRSLDTPADSEEPADEAPAFPSGGRPTAITVEIDVPDALRFTPPTVVSTTDATRVDDASLGGGLAADDAPSDASISDTTPVSVLDETRHADAPALPVEDAPTDDAGYFLLMGTPSAPTPAAGDTADDEAPSARVPDEAPAASGPRIATEFLATLRWRQMPAPNSSTSVLAWLHSVCEWLTTQDDIVGAFAADEVGLPITSSSVDDDTVAVAVAMRQAMARVHALHHDVSYGHSLYRHAAQQFVHLAWAASEHGVVTVGVVSAKPLAEGLMDTLTHALESSVQGQSFV